LLPGAAFHGGVWSDREGIVRPAGYAKVAVLTALRRVSYAAFMQSGVPDILRAPSMPASVPRLQGQWFVPM
jgi:hypothetical protein